MYKRFLFILIFFFIVISIFCQNIYYFYFRGGVPEKLKDSRLVSCFMFFNLNTQDYYIGIEWVTHTSNVILDETYVKNFIMALNIDNYEMSYLGTKQPKELKDFLKGNYESYIDSRSSLTDIVKQKEFGCKVFDHIIMDKKGNIAKIEYVTATVKEDMK